MRILILANFDVGLYQFRKELIAELQKEHQVFISLPYGKLVDKLVDMGCEFIDTPIDRRGINPLKDLKLLRRYFSIVNDIEPDLVITYTIKPNLYGGFVCKIKKVRYAVNITGLGTAFERGGLLRKIVVMMYKVSLKKAKVVFFENSANQQLFTDEKIVREDQTCLLNGAGVNLEHYAYAEYPHNDKTHFLFIGRVMKEKGIDELLEAMKRLVDEEVNCCLDVVGPCEDDYEDVLRMYEQEGWLKYYGYQDDVRPFIKACDCFVLPSFHEGMANTNLECAAMGRPVITSDIPGCFEAVKENLTGYLCKKKDSDDLYRVMKKLIELTYDKKRSMGLFGREYMEEKFDKRIVVKETVDKILE